MHLEKAAMLWGLFCTIKEGQSSWCALWVEAGHKMHSAQIQEGSGLNTENNYILGRVVSKSSHFFMLLQASDPTNSPHS